MSGEKDHLSVLAAPVRVGLCRVTTRKRLLLFVCAGLVAITVNLAVNGAASHLVSGRRFAEWWFLLPVLVASALRIRPVWAVVFPGLAAGAVASLSLDASLRVSYGATWSAAVVLGELGLGVTILLLTARLARIFPAALTEARMVRARRLPATRHGVG